MEAYRKALDAVCESHRDVHGDVIDVAAAVQASHDDGDRRVLDLLTQAGHIGPNSIGGR